MSNEVELFPVSLSDVRTETGGLDSSVFLFSPVCVQRDLKSEAKIRSSSGHRVLNNHKTVTSTSFMLNVSGYIYELSVRS